MKTIPLLDTDPPLLRRIGTSRSRAQFRDANGNQFTIGDHSGGDGAVSIKGSHALVLTRQQAKRLAEALLLYAGGGGLAEELTTLQRKRSVQTARGTVLEQAAAVIAEAVEEELNRPSRLVGTVPWKPRSKVKHSAHKVTPVSVSSFVHGFVGVPYIPLLVGMEVDVGEGVVAGSKVHLVPNDSHTRYKAVVAEGVDLGDTGYDAVVVEVVAKNRLLLNLLRVVSAD